MPKSSLLFVFPFSRLVLRPSSDVDGVVVSADSVQQGAEEADVS